MAFGLPDPVLEQIKACFAAFPDIEWVKVYGSRAMGTEKSGSDIDLAFAAPEDYSVTLQMALEELPTPYLFDVTHYDSLQNENLKSHIDRIGKPLCTQADLNAAQ